MGARQAPRAPAPPESSYRRIAEQMPCVLWSADPSGAWNYVNPAWTRFTGQEAVQALGRGWMACIPERQRMRIQAAFAHGAAAATGFELAHEVRLADGSLLSVHTQVHPSFADNRQFVGFVGCCMAQPQPAQDPRDDDAALPDPLARHLLDLVPVALARFDRDLRYVYANRTAARWLGLEPGSLDGKTARELGLEPSVASAHESVVAEVFASGRERTLDYRIGHGAEARHFRLRALPEGDAGGGVGHVFVLIHDVSAWVGAQGELDALLLRERTARMQAETAVRVRDQFLAAASHELRSPLNGIQSWAHVLESRADTGVPAVARALAGIRTGVQQQVRLIDELLDLTQAMTGRLQLSRTPVLLGPLVRDAAAGLTARAAERGMELRIEGPLDGEFKVWGDPGRLAQIMANLLSNAIKYGEAGGGVAVRLEAGEGEARIAVGAAGHGIAPEAMPYLFNPFRKAEASRVSSSEGLGPGLMLARHLVELHGGRLAVHSAGEGGAVFVVRLPLAGSEPAGAPGAGPEAGIAEASEAAADDADGAAMLRDLRVLLIDAAAHEPTVLRASLQQAGAAVTVCESGTAAVAYLQDAGERMLPHVLVSDLDRPGADGGATLVRIREFERRASHRFPVPTPAIALTSSSEQSDRVRALASGFQVYLAKPVEFAQLAGLIRSLARPGAAVRHGAG